MPLAVATITGHLGGDPEIRKVQNGEVCSFSVAVNQKRGGEEQTDWYRCVTFYDKQIEVIEKYLRKGSKVTVSGRLGMQKWEDRDGNERLTPEISINDFDLGGDPPGPGGGRDRDDRRGGWRDDRGGRDRDDRRGGGGRDDRGGGRDRDRDDRRGSDRDRGADRRDDRGGDRGRDRDEPRGGTRAAARDEPRGGGRADDRRAPGGGDDLNDEVPFGPSWQ